MKSLGLSSWTNTLNFQPCFPLEVFNDLKVFHDNTPFGLDQMVPPLFLREGKSLPCRLAQSFSSDRENRRAEITRGVVENELETGDGIVSLKNGWK
ncbi:hypothetical protein ACFX15_031343 [Malus domestica]